MKLVPLEALSQQGKAGCPARPGKEFEMTEEKEEKMELTHEPVPGYRRIFFIAVAIGVLYLGIILWNTM